MNNIALVNDQPDQLATIHDQFEIALDGSPNWKLTPIKPFNDINEYPTWILENEITILVLDEKLYGGSLDDGSHVDYTGHQVAELVRESNKELPIISLSNYAPEEELLESLDNFHLILGQDEFDNNFDNYFNLIKKLSESYFEQNQDRLNRISEISELIAKGNGNEELFKELNSLRAILSLPHFSSGIEFRSQVLDLMEGQIEEIAALKKEIQKYLKDSEGANDVV
ncbi:MAG: hypothetical protein ACMZ7B_01870 [Balneola sp.]